MVSVNKSGWFHFCIVILHCNDNWTAFELHRCCCPIKCAKKIIIRSSLFPLVNAAYQRTRALSFFNSVKKKKRSNTSGADATESDWNFRPLEFPWESAWFFLAWPWEIISYISFLSRNTRLIFKIFSSLRIRFSFKFLVNRRAKKVIAKNSRDMWMSHSCFHLEAREWKRSSRFKARDGKREIPVLVSKVDNAFSHTLLCYRYLK